LAGILGCVDWTIQTLYNSIYIAVVYQTVMQNKDTYSDLSEVENWLK